MYHYTDEQLQSMKKVEASRASRIEKDPAVERSGGMVCPTDSSPIRSIRYRG